MERKTTQTHQLEFPMELFLENDSVLLTNRMVVAATNLISENCVNMTMFNDVFKEQYVKPPENVKHSSKDVQENPTDFFKIISEYSGKQYEARFKMKNSTVQVLINFLKEYQKSSCSSVPLEKKVHIFLWLLTSEASFREVGTLFALQKSSVSYIFYEIASLLSMHKNRFISWPSIEVQHMTSSKVYNKLKLPNCVGFIDACPFRVGSKRNKRDLPETVLLQAVCDDTLMFLDIHVGPLGVTKKSRVFRDSTLSCELKIYVEFRNHILGNVEYKLKKYLITPFKEEELVTNEEIKFNEVHLKARAYIEHAFGLLTERFVRLRYIDVSKPEALSSVITAACVLHNLIQLHENHPAVKQEAAMVQDSIKIDKNIVKNATEKRQFLCNYINYIDET